MARYDHRQGVALNLEQSDAVHLLIAAAKADVAAKEAGGIETESTKPKNALTR